jgi:type I restriction enzyme S subunit
LSEYLYFFLRQKFVIENGRGVMTGAVGHRRVPGHYFENLDIPLPTLEKQREIVAKLETSFAEIDTIRNQIAIKKDFARMLRQSLLSQSFPAIDERVSA